MFKTIAALAVVATLGAATLTASAAEAGYRKHGFHGRSHGHFVTFNQHRNFGYGHRSYRSYGYHAHKPYWWSHYGRR